MNTKTIDDVMKKLTEAKANVRAKNDTDTEALIDEVVILVSKIYYEDSTKEFYLDKYWAVFDNGYNDIQIMWSSKEDVIREALIIKEGCNERYSDDPDFYLETIDEDKDIIYNEKTTEYATIHNAYCQEGLEYAVFSNELQIGPQFYRHKDQIVS